MAKTPVIKITNLAKKFKIGDVEVQALQSVSLEIYSGEFICFFGPSGCGKSTLMSMIAGLQPPSTGSIMIRGENLAKMNSNELAGHRRTKIGMVFQAFNLIQSMNVLENIALPLVFARIGYQRRMKRAENLLDIVGMTKYKTRTPSQLSGGQQQRIAIARSLVANPWIILADEPTGNLDSKSANEVMRLLISLNRKSKRTVILITHNPDYVQYADRIFFMQDGKVTKIQVNEKANTLEEERTKKGKKGKKNKDEEGVENNDDLESLTLNETDTVDDTAPENKENEQENNPQEEVPETEEVASLSPTDQSPDQEDSKLTADKETDSTVMQENITNPQPSNSPQLNSLEEELAKMTAQINPPQDQSSSPNSINSNEDNTAVNMGSNQ
jgi:putative ABC transport system ATP-binding protein